MDQTVEANRSLREIIGILLVVCFLCPGFIYAAWSPQPNTPIQKIACIGNSVTYGSGLVDRDKESYPAQLQRLLGANFQVANFGLGGATLLAKGHRPYIFSENYRKAMDYKADIVIIDLGLNDTDPRNWPFYKDDFTRDYLDLIHSFKNASGKDPKVYICQMSPIFHSHPRFKSGTRDWFWQIQEAIKAVAKSSGAQLIDIHTPLYARPDLFADALHPDVEGAGIIAKTIGAVVTGNFGGFSLAQVFGDHMVFQQKKPIKLFGKANAQDQIKVHFAGLSGSCLPGSDGKWSVELPPVAAGGPYRLEILVNEKVVVDWNDLIVGEVWFCSGQSNMEFTLDQAQGGKEEAMKAIDPNIRLFNFHSIAATSDTKWDSVTLKKVNQLKYFEGSWERCAPEVAGSFSAIAYHFGKELRKRLGVPVGLIQVAVGGAPAESFIDRYTIEHQPQLVDVLSNWSKNDFIMEWCRQRALVNMGGSKNPLQRHPYMPSYIFEAGISVFCSFPVAGILWYQGESNAHNTEHYEVAFPALVRSWRTKWGQPEMPFIVAQLSSIQRPGWEFFRDAQRRLAGQIAKCYLVVTSDLGDSLNVHPVRKLEVGHRFALQALQKVYGQSVQADGPLPLKAVKSSQSELTIIFGTDQVLRTSDNKSICELEAAGSDMIFYPVSGKLKNNTIFIHMDGQEIRQVRYAWKSFTHGNLINKNGLPASTFCLTVQ